MEGFKRFLVCPLLIVMVMLSGCLYDSGGNMAKSEHNDTSAEIRDFFREMISVRVLT